MTAPRTKITHPEWCEGPRGACMAEPTRVAGDALVHFGPITEIPLGTVDEYGDPQVVEVYLEQAIDADRPSLRVTVSGRDCGLVLSPTATVDVVVALMRLGSEATRIIAA